MDEKYIFGRLFVEIVLWSRDFVKKTGDKKTCTDLLESLHAAVALQLPSSPSKRHLG